MDWRAVVFIAVMAAIVLAGSKLSFRNRRLPAGLRELVGTGTIFILFGVAIGPHVSGLIPENLITLARPLIIVALGWIGFLFGSHLEWRRMRRVPRAYVTAGMAEALFTFAAVAAVAWLALPLLAGFPVSTRVRIVSSVILGVCAAGTLPAGIFILAGDGKLSGSNLHALKVISVFDDIPSMLIIGIACSLFHPALEHVSLWYGALFFFISAGLGVVLGILTHWLFPRGGDVRENSLVLLGMVSLGAGAAAVAGLSPLFVTAVAGLVFANISPRKESAYGLLSEREHTLYIVFLLFAGMLFRFDWRLLIMFVPVFVIVRAASKLAGTWFARGLFLKGRRTSPLLGAGLLFNGGIALAMVVNFELTFTDRFTFCCKEALPLLHQVATTIIFAVIINEFLAPFVAVRALGKRKK